MNVALYSHLDVIEKALLGRPLSFNERRVAAHLAKQARAAKDATLLNAAFGD